MDDLGKIYQSFLVFSDEEVVKLLELRCGKLYLIGLQLQKELFIYLHPLGELLVFFFPCFLVIIQKIFIENAFLSTIE